ncbi:uncharacterized protein B0H64DRAFT_345535 [Chaetomium fimeti]|uniref:Uncharacterized protein n=1 Tax=Chaetomium fimeti TaxID=1854472 RepID=A0AAE0HBD9_9PEZI|nr:hypothetical protein B0H64DRAFT_345535 [Chaetomium fimeti]
MMDVGMDRLSSTLSQWNTVVEPGSSMVINNAFNLFSFLFYAASLIFEYVNAIVVTHRG